MSIRKLTDKPRSLPWRARVSGGKVRMFETRQEAERWVHEFERTLRLTGLPPTIEELKKHTVRELVERYLKEKTPQKGSVGSETTVLRRFLQRDICYLSLAAIKKKDAYEYRDQRLKETYQGRPIAPSTVRREVNTLQHIFSTAREEWGFENLENPFSIIIRGANIKRKRRLLDGEEEQLVEACGQCRGLNRRYVPLAMYLAIETGMRLQEIFNLTWHDVNREKRRIEIRRARQTTVEGIKAVLS
jgi:integrase